MWVQIITEHSDSGEHAQLLQLDDLIDNITASDGWHDDVTGETFYPDVMRSLLEKYGWFEGRHSAPGHYLILNLDKLQLTSRLEKP